MNREYPRLHEQFVMSAAKKDGSLTEFVNDHEKLVSYVLERLKNAEPLMGLEDNSSPPSDCTKLGDYQLVKLIWILDALERDEGFRKSIGDEMESDLADKGAAHGGLITLAGKRLKVKMIPSRLLPQSMLRDDSKYANYLYDPGEIDLTPECLFFFHFHAFEEESSRFANPTNSDLKESERRTIDGLLFTKTIGKRFNVDFYSVGRDSENRPFEIVLDLGTYEY